MRTLETERLILRSFKEEDYLDVYEYASDERVGPNAGWPPHQNEEESRSIVRMFIESNDVYAIVLKSEDKVIGSIGLHFRVPDETYKNLKQREIGYVLNPKYWGNGYVPEAVKRVIQFGFEEKGLDMIWCGHYASNNNSKRVVEKSGFNYRFTKEVNIKLLGNKLVNELFYNITREEYYK